MLSYASREAAIAPYHVRLCHSSGVLGTADQHGGPAMVAAYSATRWLARNAAGVKVVRSHRLAAASACTSLVACLPALEDVKLCLPGSDELGGLLEVLAWCPRLRALDLRIEDEVDDEEDPYSYDYDEENDAQRLFPDATAFAKLHSLTKLALSFYEDSNSLLAPLVLSDIVTALVPLTGLAELKLWWQGDAVVPAALAQLTALRSLMLSGISRPVFDAGCLDLTNLVSMAFCQCRFGRQVLPGVTALPSLTRISCSLCCEGPDEFAYQLVRLPRLQRMVLATGEPCRDAPRLWVSRLPADMGLLSSSLVRLSFSSHKRRYSLLGLMQQVALKPLECGNEFATVPAAVTALSMLTELTLGPAASR